MGEFVYGLIFFGIGMAMIIHNKALVERSAEFRNPRTAMHSDRFERGLCIITGLITSATGYITILFRS